MEKGQFSYSPKHRVSNRQDILQLIKSDEYRSTGIDANELKESYKDAERDIQRLIQNRHVYSWTSANDSKSRILFYKDSSLVLPTVDAKLMQMWESAQKTMSNESLNFEDRLKDNKLKPLHVEYELFREMFKLPAKSEAPKKKKRENKRRKRTNTHIEE